MNEDLRGLCSECDQIRPVEVIEDDAFVDEHKVRGHRCMGSGTPTQPIRINSIRFQQLRLDVQVTREEYFGLEDEYVDLHGLEVHRSIYLSKAESLLKQLERLRDLRPNWWEEWKEQSFQAVPQTT